MFRAHRDAEEITAVVREEYLGLVALIERNKDSYRLIELAVALPFYAVGFLAAATGAIATQKANVLVISTFSKDYLLARTEQLDLATTALTGRGFREVSSTDTTGR